MAGPARYPGGAESSRLCRSLPSRTAPCSSSTTRPASDISCGGGSSLAATPSPWRPAPIKALELLAVTPTAVALCDLRMPGHDGLWLADQLRREHPDTAVIIATGADGRGVRRSKACATGSSTT